MSHDEVTAPEAAELLGCSVWSVYRLLASGSLSPTRKLPGKTGSYLIPRADVLALAAERAKDGAA